METLTRYLETLSKRLGIRRKSALPCRCFDNVRIVNRENLATRESLIVENRDRETKAGSQESSHVLDTRRTPLCFDTTYWRQRLEVLCAKGAEIRSAPSVSRWHYFWALRDCADSCYIGETIILEISRSWRQLSTITIVNRQQSNLSIGRGPPENLKDCSSRSLSLIRSKKLEYIF